MMCTYAFELELSSLCPAATSRRWEKAGRTRDHVYKYTQPNL